MPQRRILIVEDNPDHQKLLHLALLRGLDRPSVTLAATKQQCLTAAEQASATEPFDCVVMDYNLPPFTAPGVIASLHRVCPDTPIIVISSSEEQRVVIDALRLGVADFIPKDSALRGTALAERIETIADTQRVLSRDRRASDRRIRALEHAAETDPLTGLYNRRFYDRVIDSDRFRDDRRQDTALLMIDVDHFKRFNDTKGHAEGDRVLKCVAETIRASIRPSDIAVRWGGEEFLVLMPSASRAFAWIAGERIRTAIESSPCVQHDGGLPVTVSVGVSCETTREMGEGGVARADHALYLAKETGRNRVCTWEMAQAAELADGVGTHPDLDDGARLERLRTMLMPSLGPCQTDHIGPHGGDVAELSRTIARRLNLSGRMRDDLTIAATFHDIGKAAVPEEILVLPRSLKPEERRIVDEHASFGADLAERAGVSRGVVELIAAHHLRFDEHAGREGTPAPHIAEAADILVVADAISAMRTNRPYRPSLTEDELNKELDACSGGQFSPRVVACVRSGSTRPIAEAA